VVDLERDLRPVGAEGVIGELGEVHHRAEALEVRGRQRAQVLEDRVGRHRLADRVEVQGAVPVEAGVESGDLVPARGEDRRGARADVAFGAGEEDAHGG
jgi:hypothetical protein